MMGQLWRRRQAAESRQTRRANTVRPPLVEPLELRQHLSAEPVPLADEPPLPVVSINPLTVVEGNDGTTAAQFTASLSQEAADTVTVRWFTVSDTAHVGSDYSNGSGTIVFTAGSTSQTFSFSILGDRVYENDETLLIRFADPIGVTLAVNEVTCTILNDDDPSGDITPPAAVTSLAAQAADGQVTLAWTNPADADFAGTLIVRRAGQAPAGGPADGITYAVGQDLAGGTVVYAGSAATFPDTGVNGTTYHYAVFAYDSARNYAGAARVTATPLAPVVEPEPTPTPTPDTTAPAATLAKLAAVKAGKLPYRFKVVYTDDVAVDAASIGHRDVLITGPRKLKLWAKLVSTSPTGNSGRIVATYQVTGPGKIWGPEDNGMYTLWLWPGQVYDNSGNLAAKKKLGVMKVAIRAKTTARAPRAQADARPVEAAALRPSRPEGLFNTKSAIETILG